MRCKASRMKGDCILLRAACEADLQWMTASNQWSCLKVRPLQEIAMGILCIFLVSALPKHALRDTIIPLVRSQVFLPRTNYLTRPPAVVTAKQTNKKTVPWSSSSRRGRHVLQCRRQQTPTYNTSAKIGTLRALCCFLLGAPS